MLPFKNNIKGLIDNAPFENVLPHFFQMVVPFFWFWIS